MNITENYKLKSEVMRSLEGVRFSSKTFSITKLTCCPRKTCCAISEVKEVMVDKDAKTLFMARGRGLHTEMQKGFTKTEVVKYKDGIRGDIDAIGERITEMYSTNISSSKIKKPEDVYEVFKMKVKQLMAYCHMSDVMEGDLLVFFMSGDYKRFTEDVLGNQVYTGITPEIRGWTLKFTNEELKKNWKKILENKEDIELALRTGKIPMTVGEEYECKNCGFSYICYGDEPIGKTEGIG